MLDRVVDVLYGYRFHYANEDELQQGVAHALTEAGIPFQREFRQSPRDRFDFLVQNSIVVECKIKASSAALLRQVARYTEHRCVHGIVVVATPRLAACLPAQFGGVQIRPVTLLGVMI